MTTVTATAGTAQNGGPPAAAKTTIELHRADELVIDPRVEREAKPRRVKQLGNEMDLDALGVVTVSRRKNDDLILLDGQHRVLALRQIGFGDWEVQCHVYDGLDLQQEAALFRKLNNADKPTAVDDFLVGLTQGDGECVVINRICKRNKLEVHRQKSAGRINCVQALRQVYNGRGSKVHPHELEATIETAVAAWGHTTGAVEGHIVGGLGEVFRAYDGEIDRDVLVTKLAKFPGGSAGLLGKARALQDIRSLTVKRCVAVLIVELYNQGRRSKVLPPL